MFVRDPMFNQAFRQLSDVVLHAAGPFEQTAAPMLAACLGAGAHYLDLSGEWPGFPRTDLELSLHPDRFDFAMPVTRRPGYLVLSSSHREHEQGGDLGQL